MVLDGLNYVAAASIQFNYTLSFSKVYLTHVKGPEITNLGPLRAPSDLRIVPKYSYTAAFPLA